MFVVVGVRFTDIFLAPLSSVTNCYNLLGRTYAKKVVYYSMIKRKEFYCLSSTGLGFLLIFLAPLSSVTNCYNLNEFGSCSACGNGAIL